MIQSITNNGNELVVTFRKSWRLIWVSMIILASAILFGAYVYQWIRKGSPENGWYMLIALSVVFLLIIYFSVFKALRDSRDKVITRSGGFYFINEKQFPVSAFENIIAHKTGDGMGGAGSYYFAIKFKKQRPLYIAIRLSEQDAAWLGKELESFFSTSIRKNQRFFGYF